MYAEGTHPEQAVLGSILLTGGRALDEINLTPEDFYDPRLGGVYKIMLRMWRNQQPVDVITVAEDEEFRKGNVQAYELHTFTSATPTAASVGFYANIINENHVRRKLVDAGATIAQQAPTLDFQYLAETARSKIDNALGIAKAPVTFVYDELAQTIMDLEKPTPAFRTPWMGLNQAIGGFRPGALYVIGARPGRGKTSIAIQSALELAKQGSVAFSSLEMRREELHKRIISATASIPMDSLMNNKMSERDWEKWAILRHTIQPAIAVDDRAEVSIGDIRTFARTVHREQPLAGVVVDYLQLMTSKDNRPRHELVADYSRQLKIMARDLNVPVLALSQLNRASEARLDKKPSLGDLRESGAIEQDADVVILLHLEEDDVMILDVAKNRHGAQATVKLRWEGQYARAV